MPIHLTATLLAALASGAALAADTQFQPFAERPGQLEFSGQLIVKPKSALRPDGALAVAQYLAPITVRHYADVDEYIVTAPRGDRPGDGENALAAQLMATGLYDYAVPNWTCYPCVVPNDPWFTQQWHHTTMGTPAAWAITTGSSDIIIAFTDTGIDITHPDLAPHRVMGYDAYNRREEAAGGSVVDLNGHGTHVAGCAAAVGNNAQGVAGVNWNARIMAIRVTSGAGGAASFDDMLLGARWAADHGAKIVSTSFTGVDYQPVETTGQYIRQRGGLYFYAAGNDARSLFGFDWPSVIVVGASMQGDLRWPNSAYGRGVDLFAPGKTIISTIMGGGYQAWDGTSMAAPVAAGVASLVWSVNPDLTPAQVEQILFSTCTDLGTPGDDSAWGWGRIDAAAAAAAALLTRPPCPGDFNGDGFLDFFDTDAFADCFSGGSCPAGKSADFNGDGFLDFFDFDEFTRAFERGC